MTPVILPPHRRLVFYLAAEEYLSEHCSERFLREGQPGEAPGLFFCWQTRPTVIFGRHQVMADEVNLPFCREHAIEVYRRKSGGGCVYSDEGNLMLSFVSPSRHSQQVFQGTISRLAEALAALGLPAVTTAHNDVLVSGRKVSGNACLLTQGGTIVHGTLLLSSNVDMLRRAITPSAEKLSHNGVQSVRQRVVTLAELAAEQHTAPLSAEEIFIRLTTFFCGNTNPITLPEADIRAIETLEQTYLDPTFIAGHI